MALLPDLAHQECVEVLVHQRVCHMDVISLQGNLVPVPSSLTTTGERRDTAGRAADILNSTTLEAGIRYQTSNMIYFKFFND